MFGLNFYVFTLVDGIRSDADAASFIGPDRDSF